MVLPFTQITATTHDAIKEMTEGIFTGDAVLKRFRENQEMEEGGKRIVAPLMTADDTSSTGGFYQRADPLTLNEYDGISASLHLWKYLYESIVIYRADIAMNSGKLGVLKLIDKKVRQGELAFRQRMLKGIFSDGTAATGALSANQFIGIVAAVLDSGTYGSIAPADLATWVSTVDSNAGVNRALTQAMIDGNFDAATEGGRGGPTVGFMDKNVYTKFKGLLTPFQQTERVDSVSGLGHKGLSVMYNGIPYMVENQCPANSIYHIDEKHLKLHVHQDNNMRRQQIKDLETADAQLDRIFLYGNVVCSERKFHGLISDITV